MKMSTDNATNLSYPNNKIIDITNGTKISSGSVIPVIDVINAKIKIIKNIGD